MCIVWNEQLCNYRGGRRAFLAGAFLAGHRHNAEAVGLREGQAVRALPRVQAQSLGYPPPHADILNILLPPREWRTPRDSYFMQYVSHDRPERQDVETLQAALDHALTDQQARPQGICPIRESLFAQVFDEIIRQVTINCPERGLMLLRLRDERKMTMAAYETAYQEGLAYGMRKQLEGEEGMGEMEGQVRAMEFRKAELERRKVELLSKQGSMQQKMRERKAADSERKQYELQCLGRQNESLRRFVETRRVVERPPEPEEEEES